MSKEGERVPTILRVGDWRVDPASCRLERGSETRRLRPRSMDLLVSLALKRGGTLLREEALDDLWPGIHVTDSSVTQCISEIRAVFGDSAKTQRVVKTIAKRGYALVLPVRFETPEAESATSSREGESAGEARLAAELALPFIFLVVAAVLIFAT